MELLNVIKIRLYVTLEPSDVSKNRGTIKCNKNMTICDIGTAQCDNGTIRCE